MADLQSSSPAARHPWIDAFVANPDAEFSDLVAGYARIAPFDRSEMPEAARMLFGPLPKDDIARQKLDQAVCNWLETRRQEGVPREEGPHLDRKLREIMDATRTVSVLSLPRAAYDLRRRYILWNSWLEHLAGRSYPDVRAEFFSTLVLTQRLVVQTQNGVGSFAFEPLWLQLCELAGSQYPESYLSIGLLGLRLLPERPGTPSERAWMTGLAKWAVTQKPGLDVFSQRWLALKTLYLAMPGHWREALAETLQQHGVEEISHDLRSFWEKDVALKAPKKPPAGSAQRKRHLAALPPGADRDSLMQRFESPLHTFAADLEALMKRYERNAEGTCESYYLVRSATNMGMRLIETGPSAEIAERGKLATQLARRALFWLPNHVHAWGLWLDALAAQGLFDAAELVGWDAIRRYPEDSNRRSLLARLLVKLPGKEDEAERLLRDTCARFPRDSISSNQLAYILAKRTDRNSQEEAEKLLRAVLREVPDNAFSQAQLANVLAKRHDKKSQDEAEKILRDLLRRSPDTEAAKAQLAFLLAKRSDSKDQEEAERLLREMLSKAPESPAANNQLAHILAKRSERAHKEEAERLLRGVLKRTPNNTFSNNQLAQLLADKSDRAGQEEAEQLLHKVLSRSPDDQFTVKHLAHLVAKRQVKASRAEPAGSSLPEAIVPPGVPQPDHQPASVAEAHVVHMGDFEQSLDESIERGLTEAEPAQEVSRAPVATIATPVEPPPNVVALPTPAKRREQPPPADEFMAVVRRGGRLRRLAIALPAKTGDAAWVRAATAEIEQVLSEDGNFAYAKYLRSELPGGAEDGAESKKGAFSTAFVKAMKSKDRTLFENIVENHPEHAPIVDVARAFLFEDRDSADRAAKWLNAGAAGETRPVTALRGFIKSRIGKRTRIGDGQDFLSLVAANDNIKMDLIESALSDMAA